MNVHVLPDRARIDARTNLDNLIERARGLPVFGPTVDFDASVWDLSPVKIMRLSAARAQNLYFTTAVGGTTVGMEGRIPLEKKFGDLIKALIVLREFSSPVVANDHILFVSAARALYAVLADRDFDPVEIVSNDLIGAAGLVRTEKSAKGKKLAKTTMYRRGQALEAIGNAINRYNIAKARISFANPFPRVAYDGTGFTDEEKEIRADRMASEEIIDAIIAMSEAVRLAPNDADLLMVSVIELLLSAPWRINELLDLAQDCVRTENAKSSSGEMTRRVGISYNGSKGAPDSIKWIPSAMVDTAERAIADIRRLTQPARDIAIWMEQNPGRAWMPDPWRLGDPGTIVSMWDIAAILGLSNNCTAREWAVANNVEQFRLRKREIYCRLGDVEAALLAMQPKLDPAAVPLSKRLFLVPRHFFASKKGTCWSVITVVGDAQVGRFLCGHVEMKSIFERLDIRDEQGKPYRVNTHALRHYLNTLAQAGMLSQLDIARWSGRKDIRENQAYNHTGGRHLAEKMQEVLESGAMEGPVAKTFEGLPPTDRKAFSKSRFATAHMTSLGGCVQDWSLAPCPSHGACAGCSDHVLIKGKPEHRAEAERLLAEHEAMLSQAKAETTEGTYGASNWVEHNMKMVEGLRRTLAVHADPEIADGTIVQA